MFKYIRTINSCSRMIETVKLPQPAPENIPCYIGCICSVSEGKITNTISQNTARYLVLSNPDKNGEQTCLRIMPGMILDATTYSDASEFKLGDSAEFYTNMEGNVDCIELGGYDCEIIDTSPEGGGVRVIVL